MHIRTLRFAGDQRLEGTPPNVAVLSPPIRRARGREETTFLLLLDLGEDVPSHLYREIREVAAQAFWSSPGSVTAALRRAVATANRSLFQANLQSSPEERLYGGLTCAVVSGQEVFLAQAGAAWACSLCGGLLEEFPKRRLPELGSAAYVDVRLAYLRPCPGDTLLLGSRWLSQSVPADALRRVLPREDMEVLLDGLEQVGSGGDFSALVARWPRQAVPVEAEEVEEPSVPEEEPPAELPEAEEPKTPPRRERPRRTLRLPPLPTLPRLPRLPLRAWLRWLGRGLKRLGAAVVGGLQVLFRRMLPGREMPARTRPRRKRQPPPENPRVMAGVALAILLTISVVSLVAWLNYGSALRHDLALTRAKREAAQAREVLSSDPAAARVHWEAVLHELESVGDNAEAAALHTEAQEALDELNEVLWVEPTLLWDFGAQARLRSLVVQGQLVFVLDAASGSVFELTLAESGDRVMETDAAPVLIEADDEVKGLVDMAWAGPGGERTADALVALEEGGTLAVYDPAWGLNRVYLGTLPDEADPVAIATFHGRLYVLDPQTDQVWRYRPEGDGYPSREPYFPVASPHPLDGARDLAIDGSIYILFADGSVEKYFEGEMIPFEVTGVPAPEPAFVAMAVNSELTNRPVFFADSADERVVVVRADGTFSAQLRAREGEFQSVQALAVNEAADRLFVLAGGRLYVLPLEAIPYNS
ncbi:MAG: hypothetical protein PVH62_04640 [Anaerolineae bacterium]